MQFLSPDAAKDLVVKEKAVLLDVREEYEFAEVGWSATADPMGDARGARQMPTWGREMFHSRASVVT